MASDRPRVFPSYQEKPPTLLTRVQALPGVVLECPNYYAKFSEEATTDAGPAVTHRCITLASFAKVQRAF